MYMKYISMRTNMCRNLVTTTVDEVSNTNKPYNALLPAMAQL